MEGNRIFYSRAALLKIQASKSCACPPRLVKRRLKYFNIYVRHIQVITSQRSSSNQHRDLLSVTKPQLSRCLIRVRYVNKERRRRKIHLPSILLTNARSVFYKMDELRLRATQLKPCIICITESWLSPDIPDSAISIDGYRIYRLDRNSHG